MPSFTFSVTVPANGISRPLDGWQYEYLPWPAEVQILARTPGAAGSILQTYSSGSETIVEESPTQVGGTAGVIPSPLNTPVQGWIAAAGDRLKLSYRNTTGAGVVVDGIIEIQPAY